MSETCLGGGVVNIRGTGSSVQLKSSLYPKRVDENIETPLSANQPAPGCTSRFIFDIVSSISVLIRD